MNTKTSPALLFKKPLIIYLEGYKKEAIIVSKTLKHFFNSKTRILNRNNRRRAFCVGDKRICEYYSIIITIGGDGTFLRTAHFISKTPIIGLNPNKRKKEGFLTTTTVKEFITLIKLLGRNEKAGKLFIDELPRITIRINNKELLEKAVNEVFIGSRKSYKTIKYEIIVGNKAEEQLSSGLIIATTQGTNAWFKSAGGIPVSNSVENNKKLYFVIREPYFGRVYKPKILSGSSELIKVRMRGKGILVLDSLSDEHSLKKGDTVVLRAEPKSLKRVIIKNNSHKKQLQ